MIFSPFEVSMLDIAPYSCTQNNSNIDLISSLCFFSFCYWFSKYSTFNFMRTYGQLSQYHLSLPSTLIPRDTHTSTRTLH